MYSLYIQDLEVPGAFTSEDFVASVPLAIRKPTLLPLSGDCLRCYPTSLDEEVEADSMSIRTLLPRAL